MFGSVKRSPQKTSASEDNRVLRSGNIISVSNSVEPKKKKGSIKSNTEVQTEVETADSESEFNEVFTYNRKRNEQVETASQALRKNSTKSNLRSTGSTSETETITNTKSIQITCQQTSSVIPATNYLPAVSAASLDPEKVQSSSKASQATENILPALPATSLDPEEVQSSLKSSQAADKLSTTPIAENSQGRPSNNLINLKKVKMVLSNEEQREIAAYVRGMPSFSGKRDATLEDSLNSFITECKSALHMYKHEPEKEKFFLEMLKTKFIGKALTLIGNMKFENFIELQNFLYLHYIPSKDPSEVMSEINTSVQRVGETILDYSERLKNLVNLVNSLIDQKYRNKDMTDYKEEIAKQAIRQFKFGIRDHNIQTGLFLEKCNTLDTATEMALKWEKIEAYRYSNVNTASANVPMDKESKTTVILEKILEKLGNQNLSSAETTPNMENENSSNSDVILGKILDKLNKQNVSRLEEKPNGNINFFQKTRFCDFCQRKGHSISECRTKKSTPFCNICHQYYHSIANCPRNRGQYNGNFQKNNNE